MKNDNKLKIAGLMLYAGEGAKTGRTVDFINTNPMLIKVFLTYLRRCCQINENRLRFYLYCFENQDLSKLIEFWCEYLNISDNQFTKPYIRKVKPVSKRVALHGVLHVRYSDKFLLTKILTEINDTLKNLG